MQQEYIGCENCNCLLKVEDGPLCAECLHLKRSEAAKRGAETRAERGTDEVEMERETA